MQSTLAGVVANSLDGTPIQDARVTLYVLGGGEERLEAVSGHDGSFRLTIQRSGRYSLHAAADGFQACFIDRLLIYSHAGKPGKEHPDDTGDGTSGPSRGSPIPRDRQSIGLAPTGDRKGNPSVFPRADRRSRLLSDGQSASFRGLRPRSRASLVRTRCSRPCHHAQG